MKAFRKISTALFLGATSLGLACPSPAAEVTAMVTATCPATGPGVLVCASSALVLHELMQLGNGKEALGPNGEVMKILLAAPRLVDRNIRGAAKERGEGAKVLNGITGISVDAIQKHGLLGGENSFFRKNLGLPW